jgi:hypothetical protein
MPIPPGHKQHLAQEDGPAEFIGMPKRQTVAIVRNLRRLSRIPNLPIEAGMVTAGAQSVFV